MLSIMCQTITLITWCCNCDNLGHHLEHPDHNQLTKRYPLNWSHRESSPRPPNAHSVNLRIIIFAIYKNTSIFIRKLRVASHDVVPYIIACTIVKNVTFVNFEFLIT